MDTPNKHLKFWLGLLLRGYFIMAASCFILIPLGLYVVVPTIGWLAASTPYTPPSKEIIEKSIRYGIIVTIWVGSVGWLSEFIPWLIKVIFPHKTVAAKSRDFWQI